MQTSHDHLLGCNVILVCIWVWHSFNYSHHGGHNHVLCWPCAILAVDLVRNGLACDRFGAWGDIKTSGKTMKQTWLHTTHLQELDGLQTKSQGWNAWPPCNCASLEQNLNLSSSNKKATVVSQLMNTSNVMLAKNYWSFQFNLQYVSHAGDYFPWHTPIGIMIHGYLFPTSSCTTNECMF